MQKAAALFLCSSLLTTPCGGLFADGSPADEGAQSYSTNTEVIPTATPTAPTVTNNSQKTNQPTTPQNTTSITPITAFTGKILRDKVRLRTQPSLDGVVVKELSHNDVLVVVGEHDDFYAVQPTSDIKAYIYRTYVLDGVVEGTHVNVRIQPTVEAPVIAQLNSGDKVEGIISPENNKWYEIKVPQVAHFYVAKEYIEKVGNADYFGQHKRRTEEVNTLLNSTYLMAQQELQKPYNEMATTPVVDNYRQIIYHFTEFPDHVARTQKYLNEFEDACLRKKVAYLEAKTQNTTESWKVRHTQLSNEVTEQKEKLASLTQELKQAHQTQNASQVYQKWVEEKFTSEINAKMYLWIPVEIAFYEKWAKNNNNQTIQDFYAEQKGNSIALKGVLESYDRPVKNKPGDYILVHKTNNHPIAYLYSTQVNLNDRIGEEITVDAVLRPNNNFAYPAYFVLGMDEDQTNEKQM